jgi:uncharacterized protein YjlB
MRPETRLFADEGRFPNSPLPLLVYRTALPPDADQMEKHCAANGWSNAWRNGIFDYHHFHSIAHEVLGVAAGWVDVQFGADPVAAPSRCRQAMSSSFLLALRIVI